MRKGFGLIVQEFKIGFLKASHADTLFSRFDAVLEANNAYWVLIRVSGK